MKVGAKNWGQNLSPGLAAIISDALSLISKIKAGKKVNTLEELELIRVLGEIGKAQGQLILLHCRAHCGIALNEVVDLLAGHARREGWKDVQDGDFELGETSSRWILHLQCGTEHQRMKNTLKSEYTAGLKSDIKGRTSLRRWRKWIGCSADALKSWRKVSGGFSHACVSLAHRWALNFLEGGPTWEGGIPGETDVQLKLLEWASARTVRGAPVAP
jgi:hypothetical protein